MPLQQRFAECGGNLFGEHCLAGTRLAFYQQGPLQGNGGIDGKLQVVRRNIVLTACKLHGLVAH